MLVHHQAGCGACLARQGLHSLYLFQIYACSAIKKRSLLAQSLSFSFPVVVVCAPDSVKRPVALGGGRGKLLANSGEHWWKALSLVWCWVGWAAGEGVLLAALS